MSEAHRLFTELGRFDDARATAVFHLESLVRLAQRVSQQGDLSRAAEYYGGILPLTPEGSRLRSYVLHYQHYNLARAGLEADTETLRAYREARELWPGNALWWGREIGLLFELGRDADGKQRLVEAQAVFNSDTPQCQAQLLGVPARHLAKQQPERALRLIDRLGVESMWHPEHRTSWAVVLAPFQVGVRLLSLDLPQHQRVVFNRAVTIKLSSDSDASWRAGCEELGLWRSGARPVKALDQLALAIKEEMVEVIATRGERWDPEARARRVELLRYVDVVNSDIGLSFSSERWLVGRVEDDVFVDVGGRFARIAIPETLREPRLPDKLFLARVPTHKDGSPAGDVLELQPVLSGAGGDAFSAAR